MSNMETSKSSNRHHSITRDTIPTQEVPENIFDQSANEERLQHLNQHASKVSPFPMEVVQNNGNFQIVEFNHEATNKLDYLWDLIMISGGSKLKFRGTPKSLLQLHIDFADWQEPLDDYPRNNKLILRTLTILERPSLLIGHCRRNNSKWSTQVWIKSEALVSHLKPSTNLSIYMRESWSR